MSQALLHPPIPGIGSADPALSVRNLSVDFRARRGNTRIAVRQLSFDVAEGECLALIGVAGSGKTTTLDALCGLLPNQARIASGMAIHGGQDLLSLSPRRIAALRGTTIAVLRHDVNRLLDPLYRIREHLAEALRQARLPALAKAPRDWLPIFYELGFVEPESVLARRPNELPTSLLQRTILAIALLTGAKLILADEPTAGMDAIAEAQFLHLLDELRRRRNVAIVLGTGSFGVARFLADRVLMLYEGGEVESGTTDDLLATPKSPYTQALVSCVPKMGEYRSRLGEVRMEAVRAAAQQVMGNIPALSGQQNLGAQDQGSDD
ncbi:MAG: ATP-binding cassette domain-containing protein [Verrucomicrobiales bacterium]